jgi:hypothetical protein
MIKQPVQQLKSALRLIFEWKYVSPSGSHLIGQGYQRKFKRLKHNIAKNPSYFFRVKQTVIKYLQVDQNILKNVSTWPNVVPLVSHLLI